MRMLTRFDWFFGKAFFSYNEGQVDMLIHRGELWSPLLEPKHGANISKSAGAANLLSPFCKSFDVRIPNKTFENQSFLFFSSFLVGLLKNFERRLWAQFQSFVMPYPRVLHLDRMFMRWHRCTIINPGWRLSRRSCQITSTHTLSNLRRRKGLFRCFTRAGPATNCGCQMKIVAWII